MWWSVAVCLGGGRSERSCDLVVCVCLGVCLIPYVHLPRYLLGPLLREDKT